MATHHLGVPVGVFQNFDFQLCKLDQMEIWGFYIDASYRISFDTFWDEPVWGKGYDSLSVCEGKPFNHLWYLNVLVAYGIFGLLFVFMWFIAIVPVRAFFISRYSVALLFYIFIFLLLAPPPMLFSMVLAFLYWERRQQYGLQLLPHLAYAGWK